MEAYIASVKEQALDVLNHAWSVLRAEKKARGWTNRHLANISGVSEDTVKYLLAEKPPKDPRAFPMIMIAMAICILWVVVKITGQKFFKKLVVWCCISGVVSLIVLSITSREGEPFLPINGYTLGTSCLFGIPGVVLLMLTKILWQLS